MLKTTVASVDPMTLLVAAIGSLSACIAYLYKRSMAANDALQKKYDDLLEYQRKDMAVIISKYAKHSQDYARIIRSEIPTDRTDSDSDTLLRMHERKADQ